MKGFAIVIFAAVSAFLLMAFFLRPTQPPEQALSTRPIAVDEDAMPVEKPVELVGTSIDIEAAPDRPAASDEATMFGGEAGDAAPFTATESEGASPSAPASALPAGPEEAAARDRKSANPQFTPGEQLTLDQTATTDTSLRNSDFPRTYISAIEVDLTSPNHWVKLTWSGPQAASQETGPFHSSPGRGLGTNNCDDFDESNRSDSNCTPKGQMQVQGFSDSMPSYTHCRFVTWFLASRGIAFHYYPSVPNYPASHGCVRLDERAAQLIHNNAKIGATQVTVDGTWTFGQ